MGRRLSAAILTLVLVVGHIATCAGWAATPEARMACCAEGGVCPMHKSASHDSTPQRVITQAQADSCCASSEREEPGPSTPMFAATISSAVLGLAIVLPASVPALVVSDAWRTAVPIRASSIPKHVLLSVFLV